MSLVQDDITKIPRYICTKIPLLTPSPLILLLTSPVLAGLCQFLLTCSLICNLEEMDGDENGMSGEDEEKENEDGDAEELHLVEGKFYQDPKYNLSGIISHT